MFGIERQNINGSGYEYMRFDSNDRIDLYLTLNGSNWSGKLQTHAVFKDTSAWMHVVLVCDITNSTAGDRIRLYVNGERITTFDSSSYPSTSEQTTINHTGNHNIGKISANSQYYDGYLADVYFIDGQALDPTYFGEFDEDTGVWIPKEYTNTTTTNVPITAAPTLSNGALIIKGVNNNTLQGIATSQGGNLNFWTSVDGINWSHSGAGQGPNSIGGSSVKYVGMGGAGTSNRTWASSGPDFEYALWNSDTSFDSNTGNPGNVTGLTYTAATSSNFGQNGFKLNFSNASSLGEDQSERGNDFTPANLVGLVGGADQTSVATATGALPIYSTTDTYGKSIASGPTLRSDSLAQYLQWCVPFSQGSSGQLNDLSPTGRTSATRNINGGPGSHTTAHNIFYGGSNYFSSGTSGSFSTNVWDSISASSSEFTIEFWVKLTSSSQTNGYGATIFSSRSAGNNGAGWIDIGFQGITGDKPMLRLQVSQGWDFKFNYDGSNTNAAFPVNEWTHVAVSRDSNNKVRLFGNGMLLNTQTNSGGITSNSRGLIGGHAYGSYQSNVNFYLTDVRIYTTAKYTAAFNPPYPIDIPRTSSALDRLLDTPTNTTTYSGDVIGNYATWNINDHRNLTNGPTYTLSNGALTCDMVGSANTSSTARGLCVASIQLPTSGKWFAEFDTENLSNDDFALGIASSSVKGYYNVSPSGVPGAYLLRQNGVLYHPTGQTGSESSRKYYTGDVVGVLVNFDLSTPRIAWYRNGVIVGDNTFSREINTAQGPFFFSAGTDAGGNNAYKLHANFGQRPWKYPINYSRLVIGSISTNATYNHTKLFDGDLTTYGSHSTFSSNYTWYGNLTDVTSLRVYLQSGSSIEPIKVKGNLGTVTHSIPANTSFSWVTLPLTNSGTSVEEITVFRGGSGQYIDVAAIEVNGTILVDSDADTGYKELTTQNFDDPLIEKPSKHFDAKLWTGNGGTQLIGGGIRYSDYVTGDIDSSFPAYRAFRNVTASVGVRTATANGATIVWQPPSPIAFTNSFKIWAARDGTHSGTSFTVTHAGGTTDFTSSVVTSTTQTAVDLAQVSGVTSPITKITVVSGSSNPRFSGIEVDGSMLIDSTGDGYEFDPEFAWIKSRSEPEDHSMFDTNRGATNEIRANRDIAEASYANTLTSFDSDGFTLGNSDAVNKATATYVGWGWDGGDLATISAGGLNSTIYDQSQTWSSDFTGPSGSLSYIGAMFDGNLATEVYASTHPATITWTPSNGLAYTSMRINARTQANHSNGVKYKIVGGSEVSIGTSTTATWYTLPANSTLEYIKVERPSGSNAAGLVAAVEKDGKLLVDATATPANVPQTSSTVRANKTAGFSFVTWENPTATTSVAHGLTGDAPEMILTKSRDSTQYWQVYHHKITNTQKLYLNDTSAQVSSSMWPQYPTQHEFSINDGTNDSWIAYCFSSIEGYSLISDYQSTSAKNFIYCGFKPAFLIVKKVTNSGDASYEGWIMFDSARGKYNLNQESLYANRSYVESKRGQNAAVGSTFGVDFMSNGFVFRDNATEYNRSNNLQYVFMAIAEHPFKTARAT